MNGKGRWFIVSTLVLLIGAFITSYTFVNRFATVADVNQLEAHVNANTEELARRAILAMSIPLALSQIQRDVNSIHERLARIEQRLGIPRMMTEGPYTR